MSNRISLKLAASGLAFLLICWHVASHSLIELDLRIATSGWSPIDWVNHLRFPQNFTHDFPSGIEDYGKSLFLHVYPLGLEFLGIQPERLITWVIRFEVLFLGLGVLCVARALRADDYSPWLADLLLLLYVVSSNARESELARWGHSFIGLYYNAADGLRLLGIALAFRERWVASAAVLALAFCTHPIMALMAILFLLPLVLSRVLFRTSGDSRRGAALGAAVFCVLGGSWWSAALWKGNPFDAVDNQAWLASARVFSFHFFPVDYGLLTREHHERLIPFLALMLLTWHYLRAPAWDKVRSDVARGLTVLAAATAAGYAASELSTSPTLIRLALHRAGDMMILVGLVIVSSGLVHDVLHGAWGSRILALALGTSPFVLSPGFPLALAWLLVLAPGGRSLAVGSTIGTRSIRIGAGLTMILAAAYAILGYLGRPQLPAYVGSWRLFTLTLLGSVGILVIRWAARAQRHDLVALGVAASILWLAHQWQRGLPTSREEAAFATGYLQAQVWARDKTPATSLFLVDPTIYYGWRDYSRRSSTGNMREWLHTSWLYEGRRDRYLEGLRRLRAFGLDFQPYTGPRPSLDAYSRLHKQLERSFYALPEAALGALAGQWGAQYVVILRAKAPRAYAAKAVFSNEHVAIYETARLAAVNATTPSDGISAASVPGSS